MIVFAGQVRSGRQESQAENMSVTELIPFLEGLGSRFFSSQPGH